MIVRLKVSVAPSKAVTCWDAIFCSMQVSCAAVAVARRATATPAQLTCIEQKIASQQVTAFDGATLTFSRTITLR